MKQDAQKFPLVGSAMLFGLFLAFKFLPKELVNAILGAYFVFLGMLAITATFEPIFEPFFPSFFSTKSLEAKIPPLPVILSEGAELQTNPLQLIIGCASTVFCAWYYQSRFWMANNILGLAFSLQGIEHLSLGAVHHGVWLLCGLFFYDIFWVFCTPVMVSVAKNFDAPIKLLFPKGTSSIEGKMEFSMLGLGDIVIPGIFVAIILRYDAFAKVRSAAHKLTDVRPKYFYSAMGGYAAGMVATIVVMNVFKAAQPALLYIVPGVLGSVGAHAAWNGELHELLAWKEHDEEEEEADEGDKKSKNKSPGKTPVKSSRGGDVDVNGAKRMTRSATKPSKKDS